MKSIDKALAIIAGIVFGIGFILLIAEPTEGGIFDSAIGIISEKILSIFVLIVGAKIYDVISEEGKKAIGKRFSTNY